jgi:hypothetical protein
MSYFFLAGHLLRQKDSVKVVCLSLEKLTQNRFTINGRATLLKGER